MSADLLFDVERPAYTVPSMAEIMSRDNGLTAVSTFSGCGGSSLGLHMAGWRIPYAVEFIPAARETYEANFPETYVDPRDIREITGAEILDRIGLAVGELDLFEGSPPCSSFSSANGSTEARYGKGKVKDYSEGVKQATDDLFDEWLRLVEEIRPRAILAENVPGLLLFDDASEFFGTITERLAALDYIADGAVYNAAHYGSVTDRRRLVIRGVRRDAGSLGPRPSRTSDTATVGDALATMPSAPPQEELDYAAITRASYRREWEALEPGEVSPVIFQIKKSSPSRPLWSITAWGAKGAADPMHFAECRKFTATELAWFFGYPADFTWTGTPMQRYERIARSVPPPLYAAHGAALTDALRGVRA